MQTLLPVRLLAIAAFLVGLIPSLALSTDYSKLPAPYPVLMAEAEEMAQMEAIMPIRIFNLASRFAEAPDPELTVKLVDQDLTRSTDKWGFVRRVGYTTQTQGFQEDRLPGPS
ncbi:hypothetical protein NB640_00215 [Oxalobacter vibrioformis]|uniref:Uncharacterized protein n=1 Tax=Oxalobacter vibrioformis TaxID=933080 RepID=A0A9E9LZ13_9BURK|nr:hypothetical protein [Oxalobacter vibrioformis]WAW10134.1 hypothetical protein NB640_00215 [Oxalobacter vibrioformis]